MNERAFRERQILIPIGESEGLLKWGEVATTAGEENVGGERLDVFKLFERKRGAGEPDGKAALDGGGSLGDGDIGEF